MPIYSQAVRQLNAIDKAKQLARSRQHFVSHLSSNTDSLKNGFQERSYGVSFAREPHERMSSPVADEPGGQRGVVFAHVGGDGLDYAQPADRAAIDEVLSDAIQAGGTSEDAIRALRSAGISWVNNWNSIGEAPELHALNPALIHIRKIVPLSSQQQYRFPSPSSELGIVTNGDWRSAATAGTGQPEIRQPPASR